MKIRIFYMKGEENKVEKETSHRAREEIRLKNKERERRQ